LKLAHGWTPGTGNWRPVEGEEVDPSGLRASCRQLKVESDGPGVGWRRRSDCGLGAG
jgi:hypothetical protein